MVGVIGGWLLGLGLYLDTERVFTFSDEKSTILSFKKQLLLLGKPSFLQSFM